MNSSGKLRYWLFGALVFIICGVVAAKLTRDRAEAGKTAAVPVAAQPAMEFLPGDLLVLARSEWRRTASFSGTLIALNTALVKVKVAGELVSVSVRQGESVKAGQVVARVDPTDVQARVNARMADVEVAKAQLQLAEKNRDTQKALLEKNFISKNAFDSTQSGFDVALARLHVAEAELVSARKALGDAVLLAPIAGMVADRFAEPGERVAVDARVLSIVDLGRMEIEASLPPAAVGLAQVGQAVEFSVDGFGDRRFSGRISRISPAAASGTRSVNAYIALDNPGGMLRAGLFAQGDLLLSRAQDVLSVPAASVREEGGKAFVYAIDGETLRRRPVEVARDGPDAPVRILSGLAAGDTIVRGNLGSLREGARVRIRSDAPRPR